MAQSWEDSMPEDIEQNKLSNEWARDQDILARAFSMLLQQAWLLSVDQMVSAKLCSLHFFRKTYADHFP